ncbi:MAG: hypothetical protein JJU05_09245 [Verrucomicrobia bacterium]|nr:hypothetical protein [Verrucomicrobiota bacterium]MCH8527605.1 hypothetical protein [Kiritimatiellia bacterium]
MHSFYFRTYTEWRQALTERCGISLTSAYARGRIQALRDTKDPTTAEFTRKYGEAYLQQVIRWFEQSAKETH